MGFGKRESKARGSRKAFSEKEEKVLMRAIKRGKEKCVTKLAKKLSRPPQSVRDRIKKLKTGNPLHTFIRFTAEEDRVLLLVIREGKDGDVVRLAKTLDRSQNSVRTRVKKLKFKYRKRRIEKGGKRQLEAGKARKKLS